MRLLERIILIISFLFGSNAFAQAPEMADQMRSEGKIYVVVAIVLVVLLGLIVYLFVMDSKVSRLEKKLEKKA